MSGADGVFGDEDLVDWDPSDMEADDASESELREQLAQERAAREDLEAQFQQFKREMVEKVNRLENAVDGNGAVGQTELEQYATAPEDIRAGLSTNKERAVKLYEDWQDIAWKQHSDHGGSFFVDTQTRSMKKNHPSKLKHTLETRWDESLTWNDIYRTMKKVALMSGGESLVDEYGRTHITGGGFEYHERPTPDSSKVKRVLAEADQ